MRNNSAKDQYFKDIKTLLPIKTTQEKKYLSKINKNLNEYQYDNPNSSYNDYIEKFGTAKDVVVAYLQNCNEDYLISKLKIRSILIKVITFITLISILICIWFAYILKDNYYTAKKEHIWDSETTIIEE